MTWDDIATAYDVRRCHQCGNGDHHRGWAARSVVHWSNRRMTKAGLRRYLMLIASQRLLNITTIKTWERIYRLNAWAARAAGDLHTRIPSRLFDADRARVRWLMRREPSVPDHVKRWANHS